jgi:hypothetical protein
MDKQPENGSSIEQLGLEIRTYNILKSANYTTIEQLYAASDAQLLKIRNVGKTVLNEIHEKLKLPLLADSHLISNWTFEQRQRQAEAYTLLIKIEERIRTFIYFWLSEKWNQNWWSEGVLRAIVDKNKIKQINNSLKQDGIFDPNMPKSEYFFYVDFGLYKELILDTDNWINIFSFRVKSESKDSIETHLKTINNRRRSIAHSRPISESELVSLKQDARYIGTKFCIGKNE